MTDQDIREAVERVSAEEAELRSIGLSAIGLQYRRQEAPARQIAADLRLILAALTQLSEANEARKLLGEAWGALNFILAFYEPGQKHLDTNAWKNAEASGRHVHAKLRAFLDRPPAHPQPEPTDGE